MHNSWKSVKNVLFKKYFEKIFLNFFLKKYSIYSIRSSVFYLFTH